MWAMTEDNYKVSQMMENANDYDASNFDSNPAMLSTAYMVKNGDEEYSFMNANV